MQEYNRLLTKIDKKLHNLPHTEIAEKCGFTKRNAGKITPDKWIKAFCCLASGDSTSLRYCAWILGLLTNTVLSKQAVRKRLIANGSEFLKQTLAHIIANSGSLPGLRKKGVLTQFNRVLVQDSTTIKLPQRLVDTYTGCSNHTNIPMSLMRIQAVLDILSETFVHFSFSGYTRNDQAAAHDIINITKKGDLVIRDLGYFVINVFSSFYKKGVFFISRVGPRNIYKDIITNDDIDLLVLLRKNKRLDQKVILGRKKPLPVRLVAIPLPVSVANERKRKARLRRDKGSSYSKKYFALLSWQILITNVEDDVLSAQDLSDIYGLRWQIEIVFKTWKSFLHFEKISQNASVIQVEALIYARLIYVVLFHVVFWRVLQPNLNSDNSKSISMLKSIDIISSLSSMVLIEAIRTSSDDIIEEGEDGCDTDV